MDRLSYVLVAVTVLAACQDAPTALEAPDAPLRSEAASAAVAGTSRVVASATGSGHRVRNDRALVFTFHAVRKADGSSGGKYYLDWQDLGPALDHKRLQVEVDVTCMSAVGNRAWIAGIITKVDGPIAREGTVSYFYVTDNGEGEGVVDEISGLRLNDREGEDLLFCDQQPVLLGSTAIERGNAQVRVF